MYTGFYGSARMKFIPTILFVSVKIPFVSIKSQWKKDADECRFFSISGIILTPRPHSDER